MDGRMLKEPPPKLFHQSQAEGGRNEQGGTVLCFEEGACRTGHGRSMAAVESR